MFFLSPCFPHCFLSAVMSVNSSLLSNLTLPTSPPSFDTFFPPVYLKLQSCYSSTSGTHHSIIYTTILVLLFLPLYILIFYLAIQRWWQQRSRATSSHSDHFTYQITIMELTNVFGSILLCWSIFSDLPKLMMVAFHFLTLNMFGVLLFHTLTCVERYLAVVHPVTYVSLRGEGGIRLRKISIGCVWLVCFATVIGHYIPNQTLLIVLSFGYGCFILIVISFCSLSVLCALIRPGPGEESGRKQQVDQKKLKAFYTIMIILGALCIRSIGSITGIILYATSQLFMRGCDLWFFLNWINLPSSLVLPFLFLHRAGKLCCKNNT